MFIKPGDMAKKKSLTRDQIIGARRKAGEWVDVPEWGGSVFIRRITLAVLDQINAGIALGMSRLAAQIIYTIVDPDTGEPILSAEDAEAIAAKDDAALLIRLVSESNRINSLDADAPKGGAAA